MGTTAPHRSLPIVVACGPGSGGLCVIDGVDEEIIFLRARLGAVSLDKTVPRLRWARPSAHEGARNSGTDVPDLDVRSR